MSQSKQKQDRIQPLIKIRQIQFDQETSVLSKIQQRRQLAIDELQRFQRMYIQGVDRLNRERQTPERKMLDALEKSIDYAKSQWYSKLRDLRAIEEEERQQMQIVIEAQKKLKMLEKLDIRYNEQHMEHLKKVEQKMLDEFAIQAARKKGME
jgi:flagellar export protein FliJ